MQPLVLDFLGEGSQEKRNGGGRGGKQETAGGKKLSKYMVSGINSHQPDPTRADLRPVSQPFVSSVFAGHWLRSGRWVGGATSSAKALPLSHSPGQCPQEAPFGLGQVS